MERDDPFRRTLSELTDFRLNQDAKTKNNITFLNVENIILSDNKWPLMFFIFLEIVLDGDEWKALRQWEHWHADAFVREKRQEEENKIDRQLTKLNQR